MEVGRLSDRALEIRTLALVRCAIGQSRSSSSVPKRKSPAMNGWAFALNRALAMTYFLTGNPQYHRRDVVSRSCSGWEGVGPTRYGRQEFWNEGKELGVMHCIVRLARLTQGYRIKPHGQMGPDADGPRRQTPFVLATLPSLSALLDDE